MGDGVAKSLNRAYHFGTAGSYTAQTGGPRIAGQWSHRDIAIRDDVNSNRRFSF
jgi:hypothetical protein